MILTKRILFLIFLLTIFVGKQLDASDSLIVQPRHTLKINKLNDLSTKLIGVDKDKAFECSRKALEISSKLNYTKGMAMALNNIGLIARENGDYASAFSSFELSLSYFRELKISRGVSDVYDNMGSTCYYQGNLSKALDYYLKALRIREKLHDGKAMAGSFINIGLIYKEEENYDKALEYLFKGLKVVEEAKNIRTQSIAYNNIGLCYKNTGHYDKAMEFYLKSLHIKQQLGDKNGIAHINNNLGTLYEEKGNFNKALAYHFNSLKIKKEGKNKRSIALSYASIGTCYFKKNDYAKAIVYLKKADKLGTEIGSTYVLKKTGEVLNEIYSQKGNYKEAHKYLSQFKSCSDSLQNTENARKFVQVMMKYEFEDYGRKQKIAELQNNLAQKEELNKVILFRNIAVLIIVVLLIIGLMFVYHNKKLKRTNETLKAQKQKIIEQKEQINKQKNKYQKLSFTKDKFFSIIAHDLRNPFNTLIGFSDLIISNYDTYGDEEKLKYLNIINDSSKSTYELLENLLNWAKTQTENINYSPEKILVSELITENVRFQKSYAEKKEIEINSVINDDSLVLADKNMINTVLRNLISNALKFTNSGGEINVRVNILDEFTEIAVEDNGVGISSEDRKKIFSLNQYHTTSGTLDEKGSGLGLIICKEFVEKNGGHIRVESKEGKGSKFIFSIPKARITKIA